MSATTLITCHTNADFDALAAMIAALQLYPGSILLFPGTQEENIKSYFSQTLAQTYNFQKPTDIPWDSLTRLVIVDTRQYSRVPHVHTLLAKDGVEIHLWDHHPDSPDDIITQYSTVEELGASTTLILREIQTRGLTITPDVATVLGLGIYTDTGSFTFSSTTPEDLRSAAWLLQRGMDVNAIADLGTRDLTKEQVQALNSLLESSTTYDFNDISVVISQASMEAYLGDFAYLAHKLMEMEHIDVLFAIGHMGDRMLVVARSRNPQINVGKICAGFGGGGHSYAASATVRDMTYPEFKEELFRQIYAQTNTDSYARDYMSSPAVGIEEHKTIKNADELMRGFGLKAMPVFRSGGRQCVGILDAQTAARAMAHGLQNLSIDTYMQRHIRTLAPEASFAEVMEIIVGARQRLIPIVEDDVVIGVVTRTDLINVFVDTPGGIPTPLRDNRKERSIAKIMRDRLPRESFQLLTEAGELGDTMGLAVYAVGGFVRDILLNMPNNDIDLVVEGNGIAYARALATTLGGRVREHQEFLTAVVIFTEKNGKERRIDVATARLEYYESPAALPTVEMSSIKMDLSRRDFTINSLAVRLGKGVFGHLVDFFGGQRDIKEKHIRVLHALSFIEDPTRCLRAVRFEQRYAFRLGIGAEKLIKNALNLKLMDKLSGARLFHELRLIFVEANPVAVLKRMDKIGILSAMHPQLFLNPVREDLLYNLKDILDWYHLLYFDTAPQRWFVYLLGLCRGMNYQEASSVFVRLGIPSTQKGDVMQMREKIRMAMPKIEAWQTRQGSVSELCQLVASISLEGILYMMGRIPDEGVRMSLSRYITTWSREKIAISGSDLISMGLSPGPLFGHILRRVLAAKLDGHAPTRESQLILARALAQQTGLD